MAGTDPISSRTTSTSVTSSSPPPSDIITRNRAGAIYENNVVGNPGTPPDPLNERVVAVPPVVTREMRAAAMGILRSA